MSLFNRELKELFDFSSKERPKVVADEIQANVEEAGKGRGLGAATKKPNFPFTVPEPGMSEFTGANPPTLPAMFCAIGSAWSCVKSSPLSTSSGNFFCTYDRTLSSVLSL